jgi:hypothetical protein
VCARIADTAPEAQTALVLARFDRRTGGRAGTQTVWFGIDLGPRMMLKPLCARAMARPGFLTDRPGRWGQELDRRAVEFLFGADLLLHLGRFVLSLGLAIGVVWRHTNDEVKDTDEETVGYEPKRRWRCSYPFGSHLVSELALSFNVTQATHLENA